MEVSEVKGYKRLSIIILGFLNVTESERGIFVAAIFRLCSRLDDENDKLIELHLSCKMLQKNTIILMIFLRYRLIEP